jgi:hypothetical protein
MPAAGSDAVLVQVVELATGREIAWGSSVAERLRDRAALFSPRPSS